MASGDVATAMDGLKIQPVNYDKTFKGKTSVFQIKIEPGSTAYRYDVVMIKSPDVKKKELTKQNDSGLRTMQRECCSDVIEALFKKTNGFGVDCKYVYDGKKILYTTKPIKIKQTTRITANDLEERAAIFLRKDDVDVTIMANESCPKLDYSDLKSALVADVSTQADRSVRNFLEVLTSQYLINANSHQYVSAGCLFENKPVELFDGVQMRVGFKKGVRISAGTAKDPIASMVVDMKRSAFFAAKNVADVYREFVNIKIPNDQSGKNKFEKFMKGVRCTVTYDLSRSFSFKALTWKPVNDSEYKVGGKSLPQFVEETKGFKLKYPNFPGAHPDQPNFRRIVYPLELIQIMPGQLVPVEKLNSRVARKLLEENSVPAKVRYNYIMQQVMNLSSGPAAAFLKQFGVTILAKSNDVDIHNRKQAKIRVGGKTITANPDGSWHKAGLSSSFLVPSKHCKNWIVAYDSSIHESIVKSFMKKLIDVARGSGMDIGDPKAFRPVAFNRDVGWSQLEQLFIRGKELEKADDPAKYRFIFHIDSKKNESHNHLKLFEAYYKILTQQMLSENMTCGNQTLKNLAMKLNTKTLGLTFIPEYGEPMKNYALDKDDLLVIGYDVAHPTPIRDAKKKFDFKQNHPEMTTPHPSVVGICANKMRQKFGFAGDYFYQQSRKECVSPIRLRDAVAAIAASFLKYKRTPRRVIVYRDGVSEGQYQMVANEELPVIRSGILKVFPDLDPKITFIIATKDHSKRVFREDKGEITTSQIGDSVTSVITRPDVIEFYLQSHTPLKGTAKMLQLTLIANELGMSIEEIQELTMLLSNMHQICACPTSLPLPIFLADETAKRGLNNYNTLYSMRFPDRPNVQASTFALKEISATDRVFNYDELTSCLGYGGSDLANVRFNA